MPYYLDPNDMWQYTERPFHVISSFVSGWTAVGFGLMVGAFVLWTLIWKGLALWRAGRNNDKWWFIALLLINTVGILEILYLTVFSKTEKK